MSEQDDSDQPFFQLHPSERQQPISITDIGAAVADEHRPGSSSKPWVYTNMITSLDGGTASESTSEDATDSPNQPTSGALGGRGDRAVFRALRNQADAILVGASTVRAERYRVPRRFPESGTNGGNDRGADVDGPADPLLAIVTRSLDLPVDLPLFDDPANRPVIFTVGSAPEDRRRSLAPVAEIVDAGHDNVDLNVAVRELGSRGRNRVLCEGGPRLNGQLVAEDLVDEWNLTIAPHLIAGVSNRAAVGTLPEGPPPAFSLRRVWADDDYLFCRWVSKRPR